MISPKPRPVRRLAVPLALAALLLCWAAQVLLLSRAPVAQVPGPSAASSAVWPALARLVDATLLQGPAHTPAIVPPVARWVDPGGSATLADAQQALLDGAFSAHRITTSEGLSSAAFWYAMRVRRGDIEQERWLLAVGAPFLDDVQTWVQRADAPLAHLQLGDHFLGDQRPVQARLHVAPFALAPHEEAVLWVRTRSSGVMSVSIELTRPEAYFAQETKVNALLGMFLGILMLAALSYALIGGWLRDRIMLGYAAFVATLFLLYMGNTGMLLQLVPHAPWWLNDLFAGVGAMGPLYAGLFMWIEVLNMRRNFPRIRRVYQAVMVLSVLLLPLTVTEHYRLILAPAYLSANVFAPLNLWMAWVIWRRTPDRLRLMYLVAFSSHMLGAYVLVLAMLGVLPANALTLNAYPLSSLVHTVVMAVAMAMRITGLRHDKQLAEGRAEDHRRFVAMLTHEFRNPLASIDRSANLLQVLGAAQKEPLGSRLAGIRQQVHRLHTLVDGFLTVGDGSQSAIQPKLALVDLRSMLQTLCQSMGPDLRARLRLRLPQGSLQASLDERMLRLALVNLIDNALRYSPDDQPVEVAARAGAEGGVEITVSDAGPGVSDSELGRLGQPFHRGRAAVGTQGTGLGYYFCRQIVEAHGGSIQASRAGSRGLRVTLRLP